jgi:hypothetical protein
MSFVNHFLPYFRQQLITCLLSAVYFFRLVYWKFIRRAAPPPLSSLLLLQVLFTESSCGDQLLAPLPFSSVLRAPHPLCWVSFSVPCLLFTFFFFLWGKGQSVQSSMLVYPRVNHCSGTTMCHLFTHLLVCVSQAGLEPVSGGMGVLLFTQCNVVWRSFLWARGSGCQSFASFFFFFC